MIIHNEINQVSRTRAVTIKEIDGVIHYWNSPIQTAETKGGEKKKATVKVRIGGRWVEIPETAALKKALKNK